MSGSTFENDGSLGNSDPATDISVPMKPLLTQEFNTIPSGTSTNSLVSSNCTVLSDNSGTFTCASSLPFVLSPEATSQYPFNQHSFAQNLNAQAANSFIPPPAFICQPFPFYSPEQYFLLMQQQQNKRVRLSSVESKLPDNAKTNNNNNDSSSSIVEQLNSFKTSLKSSFDRNLQKLEVLDRLVQTVTIKGSIQVESLKGLLEILHICRILLKELVIEQVDMTVGITLEIKNCLLPEILTSLKSISSTRSLLMDSTKGELVEKLRKEEDSHLTDLSILSSRNKELQKDSRALKEQLDRLQTEYADSLKLAAFERDEHGQFVSQLNSLLGTEEKSNLFEEIENLLKEKTGMAERCLDLKGQVQEILCNLENIKSTCFANDNVEVLSLADLQELLIFIVNSLMGRFEGILHERERFFNDSINNLSRKFEELFRFQSTLAHKSLSIRMGLQGQLADSQETMGRLRKHCQELTLELNNLAGEIDRKRLSLQTKEGELIELRRKQEISIERIRLLEEELSVKNQENRSFGIRIQSLQNDLEEAERKHRHDLMALERKISILETRKSEEENLGLIEQLSSLKQNDYDDSISTIPPTIAAPPNAISSCASNKRVVVTFTGIRDAVKQKELSKYLVDMGASVHVGADFNDDITHVLAPRGYKSIRVLAASLTGKWIVPVEWVEASHRTGQFVSEQLHGGYCNSTIRPFRFRTLWMSASFSVTHKSHPTYPTSALRTLLEKLGKARWCETASQADFLLVTEEEREAKLVASGRGGTLVTLNNLINMIPIKED